jgi:hypothetical protein
MTMISGSFRVLRGGYWNIDVFSYLSSSAREIIFPTFENGFFGFRVATVPEPSAMTLVALATVGLFYYRRQSCAQGKHRCRSRCRDYA